MNSLPDPTSLCRQRQSAHMDAWKQPIVQHSRLSKHIPTWLARCSGRCTPHCLRSPGPRVVPGLRASFRSKVPLHNHVCGACPGTLGPRSGNTYGTSTNVRHSRSKVQVYMLWNFSGMPGTTGPRSKQHCPGTLGPRSKQHCRGTLGPRSHTNPVLWGTDCTRATGAPRRNTIP